MRGGGSVARFELPSNVSIYDRTADYTGRPWLQWLDRIHNLSSSLEDYGTTANRPTKMLWIGRRYFDTTLNAPVWWDGSAWIAGSGGGGGVTDHGALTGLADDDHTQYFNTTRGDARYSLTTHLHTGVYDPAGTAAAAVVTHVGLADPHTQYLLESALDSGVVTITVPYPGAYEWSETVTATGVTSSQRVLISMGSHVDSDENSAELLDVAAIEALAGTDQITVTASFSTLTQGAIKLNYMAI